MARGPVRAIHGDRLRRDASADRRASLRGARGERRKARDRRAARGEEPPILDGCAAEWMDALASLGVPRVPPAIAVAREAVIEVGDEPLRLRARRGDRASPSSSSSATRASSRTPSWEGDARRLPRADRAGAHVLLRARGRGARAAGARFARAAGDGGRDRPGDPCRRSPLCGGRARAAQAARPCGGPLPLRRAAPRIRRGLQAGALGDPRGDAEGARSRGSRRFVAAAGPAKRAKSPPANLVRRCTGRVHAGR